MATAKQPAHPTAMRTPVRHLAPNRMTDEQYLAMVRTVNGWYATDMLSEDAATEMKARLRRDYEDRHHLP